MENTKQSLWTLEQYNAYCTLCLIFYLRVSVMIGSELQD